MPRAATWLATESANPALTGKKELSVVGSPDAMITRSPHNCPSLMAPRVNAEVTNLISALPSSRAQADVMHFIMLAGVMGVSALRAAISSPVARSRTTIPTTAGSGRSTGGRGVAMVSGAATLSAASGSTQTSAAVCPAAVAGSHSIAAIAVCINTDTI